MTFYLNQLQIIIVTLPLGKQEVKCSIPVSYN